MGAVVYRAAPPAALRIVSLDALSAVFHRPSGITHLVIEPAPEILAALADAPMTAEALLMQLSVDYALGEDDALAARLEELVAAGLVEAIPVP